MKNCVRLQLDVVSASVFTKYKAGQVNLLGKCSEWERKEGLWRWGKKWGLKNTKRPKPTCQEIWKFLTELLTEFGKQVSQFLYFGSRLSLVGMMFILPHKRASLTRAQSEKHRDFLPFSPFLQSVSNSKNSSKPARHQNVTKFHNKFVKMRNPCVIQGSFPLGEAYYYCYLVWPKVIECSLACRTQTSGS